MTERSEITLHGRRFSYRSAGHGPLLVLLHGIAGSSATWEGVLPWLAERYTVVAPDLIGHGESSTPEGDYSLGAYANGIRDLLEVLGHEPGTILGHSLGGGVSLQFAYQFLERCERLILVSSGGLGRELHLLLRAAALPGADVEETWSSFVSLARPGARRAFIQTVQGIIDLKGQRIAANDLLYLAADLPTLIIWGERDPLIPVRHARDAHARIPGSRLEVFPKAGHYPCRDDPRRFVETVVDFIDATKPLTADPNRLRSRLRDGAPAVASA